MALLSAPKKTAAGYYLAMTQPTHAPEVAYSDEGSWGMTAEWDTWATALRTRLLDTLLTHPTWFSRTPRREVLDPLFGPWSGRTMQGTLQFFCKLPSTPGTKGNGGTATLQLDGLLMNATEIVPIFSVASFTESAHEDQISLFGDGETVAGDEDDDAEVNGTTREIQLDEIEDAPPASAAPTRLRSREWETRKFLAKERVREARLKAQIADRLARKEEARFYSLFGDLEDGESAFSDYDLTDRSESEEDEEDDSPM